MKNRNFRIAVFGATFAMALLMTPAKVSVHAAPIQYTLDSEVVEQVADSVTVNSYCGQTLNDTTAEVFDTYTSNAETPILSEEELAFIERYKNIGISNVNDYLNIRKSPDQASEVVGTLPKNAGCTVESIDKNGWAKITSGEVSGYVSVEYLITGEEVPALVKEVGKKIGVVNAETVRLREEKSEESKILALVSIDEEVNVKDDSDEQWIRVSYDDQEGYIARELLDLDYKLATAEEVEREEEVITTTTEVKTETKTETSTVSKKTTSNKTTSSKTKKVSEPKTSSNSSVRSSIVSYAKQFVGGKYVYGGTSLTNGVDCSGFTMRVYEKFGYNITRTSRSQAAAGKTISVSSVKPGDLVFYADGGSINHVAMYIGNGQIVHASNPKTGIKISNMNYRKPCKAVRFIND